MGWPCLVAVRIENWKPNVVGREGCVSGCRIPVEGSSAGLATARGSARHLRESRVSHATDEVEKRCGAVSSDERMAHIRRTWSDKAARGQMQAKQSTRTGTGTGTRTRTRDGVSVESRDDEGGGDGGTSGSGSGSGGGGGGGGGADMESQAK